jgi:hypothetical protein
MSDLKDTDSTITIDESQYASSNYPDQYMPPVNSSCKRSTQGFKSVRITKEHEPPKEVFVRINAKLMSRKDKIQQINEAIKRSSML